MSSIIKFMSDSSSNQSQDNQQHVVDLVGALQSVDPNKPEDSLNATSISDNNGGRIELNEDLTGEKVIKK